jgi:hypothetical protein
MLLSSLLCSSISVDFRTLLEGEWTISTHASSLYTIAFHRASPSRSSVLNATLWRDDLAPSPSFTVSESPLLAELQFSFSGAHAGAITSHLPPSGRLCDFAFTESGAGLTATATINGAPLRVSFNSDHFSFTFGDYGTFQMQKVPQLSIPKNVKRHGRTSDPYDRGSRLQNVSSTLVFSVIALLTPLIAWNVPDYLRSLWPIKEKGPPKEKTE